ncbi:DUF6713 family protein [Thalassotalea ganghwensis]
MEKSYRVTMILLLIHQIDAAYWKEWEMFYLPDGLRAFLLFNVAVIPLVLLGNRSVIKLSESATNYSYLCADLRIATFIILSVFIRVDINNLPYHYR